VTRVPAAAAGGLVAVALILAGCGSSSGPGSAGASRTLVLIPRTTGTSFDATMACGARTEARRLGYALTIRAPAHVSASAQIGIVNSVIATKPAGVLIAPDGRRALIASIQSMKSAGITVIQIETAVADRSGAPQPYRDGADGVEQAVIAIQGTPTRSMLTDPAAHTRADLRSKRGGIDRGNAERGSC
jgi:ABC-type sugar transport system substrate-binding protein